MVNETYIVVSSFKGHLTSGTERECQAYVAGARRFGAWSNELYVVRITEPKVRVDLRLVKKSSELVPTWATVRESTSLAGAIEYMASGTVAQLIARKQYDCWRIVDVETGAVVAQGEPPPVRMRRDTESSYTITRECSVEEANHGEQEA